MHAQIYNALVRSAFYDYAFMVTRDPVNRLISQYKMRRQARVRRVTRLGIELDFPPFDEWVRSTLQKYSDDPYIHDNHIRPQHEFHSSGVEVFKFEEGLEKVRAKLHKLLEIGPENETPMRHVGMSSDAPISLTDETLSLIQDFYIEDYKRFGYPLRARGTVSAAVAC
jgi:hypothetical protein